MRNDVLAHELERGYPEHKQEIDAIMKRFNTRMDAFNDDEALVVRLFDLEAIGDVKRTIVALKYVELIDLIIKMDQEDSNP